MGWVNPNEIKDGLCGVLLFFRRYVSKLKALGECQSYMLIIVLGSYLYYKYYLYSTKRKGLSFWVDASTMKLAYSDQTLSDIAGSIIKARNAAAHEPFTETTDKLVGSIAKSDDLIKLLKYEGIIDEDGNFIEPEGGKYEPVKVEKKEEASTEKPAFSAAAIMSGN